MPSSVEDPIATLRTLPGGENFLTLLEKTPGLGDAEILDLHLDRSKTSILRVHDVYEDVIVTFSLDGIIGLKLDDFSQQNVIGRLEIQLVHIYPESFDFGWLHPPKPQSHYELKIEAIFGLGGVIQARQVSISLEKANPEEIQKGF